jgi:hypothetical protein
LDALQSFPTHEALVVGRLRVVGDGAFGGARGYGSAALSGQRRWCILGRRRQRIIVGGAPVAPSDVWAAALEPCI